MAETSRFIGPFIRFLFPDISPETLRFVHVGIRKVAHITEYAILGLLAFRAFGSPSTTLLSKWRYPLSIVLVALIASLDEFSQSLDASRTGTLGDLLLDVASGAAMIAILWMSKRRRGARRDQPKG